MLKIAVRDLTTLAPLFALAIKKHPLEMTDYLYIHAYNGGGVAYVSATDSSIHRQLAIAVRCACHVPAFTVHALELKRLLAKVPKDAKVGLFPRDNETYLAYRGEHRIKSIAVDEYHLPQNTEATKLFSFNGADFKRAIDAVDLLGAPEFIFNIAGAAGGSLDIVTSGEHMVAKTRIPVIIEPTFKDFLAKSPYLSYTDTGDGLRRGVFLRGYIMRAVALFTDSKRVMLSHVRDGHFILSADGSSASKPSEASQMPFSVDKLPYPDYNFPFEQQNPYTQIVVCRKELLTLCTQLLYGLDKDDKRGCFYHVLIDIESQVPAVIFQPDEGYERKGGSIGAALSHGKSIQTMLFIHRLLDVVKRIKSEYINFQLWKRPSSLPLVPAYRGLAFDDKIAYAHDCMPIYPLKTDSFHTACSGSSETAYAYFLH